MRILIVLIGLTFMLSSTSCARKVVVQQPKKVVVVKKRPASYKVVRVKGRKYYVWNGRYHKKTRRGYVVVKL